MCLPLSIKFIENAQDSSSGYKVNLLRHAIRTGGSIDGASDVVGVIVDSCTRGETVSDALSSHIEPRALGSADGDTVGSLGLGGAHGDALDTFRSRELVETVHWATSSAHILGH
jgi:hypothetical protein